MRQRGRRKRNLILKARQFGFTTFYCIDYLDDALWHQGMGVAILGHEREAIGKIFEIVKRAYENLPSTIKPKTKTDTKQAYHFTYDYTGHKLDSGIYVAMKVRSGTLQKLHITESSRVKDRSELDAGSKQAVPKDGYISEETTGNGFNEFYDLYMDHHARQANMGIMDYKTHFYPWVMNDEYNLPTRITPEEYTQSERDVVTVAKEEYNIDVTIEQIAWRRWKIDELKRQAIGVNLNGEQLFKQEYPLTILEAFQSGAGAVFDVTKIEKITPMEPKGLQELIDQVSPQRQKRDEFIEDLKNIHKKHFWIWDLPEHGRNYVIGVDPSGGLGSDFSVIDVWDKESLVQVAQYYGKVRPDELAELTTELARFYNNAYVGVENNMMSTILFLSKLYDNYYFEVKQDKKTLQRTKNLGWNTNTKTRDIMIDDFAILFDEGSLTIRSKITLSEMRTFVKKENGKREHADGKHDDSLFAGFIAIQMRKLQPKRGRVLSTKPF